MLNDPETEVTKVSQNSACLLYDDTKYITIQVVWEMV